MITKQQLIDFETDISKIYSQGKIRAPVHLVGSVDKTQERFLIKLFNEKINKQDYIFGTHRSHYIALLKSQDPKWVKSEILANRSMHINSKKHKIFTSSIVGGCLPIALGTAMALKRKKSKEKVWCFVGDMASQMGIFHECVKYATGNRLPITFIIENNTLGINTPTCKVWKAPTSWDNSFAKIIYYKYKRKYPHHGIGKFVNF